MEDNTEGLQHPWGSFYVVKGTATDNYFNDLTLKYTK